MTYSYINPNHSHPSAIAATYPAPSQLGPVWLGIGSLLLLSGWIPAHTTALGWLPLLVLWLAPAVLTLGKPRLRRLIVLLGLAVALLALHGLQQNGVSSRIVTSL